MKVSIIGAGRTGRGFIAPFFHNKAEISFFDIDENLVEILNKEKSYTVKYFESEKEILIDNYVAHILDDNSLKALSESDLIFTCIFSSNLPKIENYLRDAFEKRLNNLPLIICAENGVNVKEKLINKNINADITDAAIFCTTVNSEGLNVISEYGLNLFVNNYGDFGKNYQIDGIEFIDKFENLIKRKIYTYNLLSAVFAYYGYYKNFEYIDQSSNDEEIREFVNKFITDHNEIIAEEYEVNFNDQERFSIQALNKFSNTQIKDNIKRNAQGVSRKLGKDERMVYPYLIASEKGKDNLFSFYGKIIALAINYGIKEEQGDLNNYLEILSESLDPILLENIIKEYNCL